MVPVAVHRLLLQERALQAEGLAEVSTSSDSNRHMILPWFLMDKSETPSVTEGFREH